jgi:hypothetical protein
MMNSRKRLHDSIYNFRSRELKIRHPSFSQIPYRHGKVGTRVQTEPIDEQTAKGEVRLAKSKNIREHKKKKEKKNKTKTSHIANPKKITLSHRQINK